MATKNPIDDIISLGEKLAAARDLIDRTETLEQACGEAESRIAALRSAERDLEADCSRRRVQLNEQEQGAIVQATAIKDAARAEASEHLNRARAAVVILTASAEARVADLDAAAVEKAAACETLEAEETRLAQSVEALRAELADMHDRIKRFVA